MVGGLRARTSILALAVPLTCSSSAEQLGSKPTYPLTSRVTLGKSLCLSNPQFSLVENGYTKIHPPGKDGYKSKMKSWDDKELADQQHCTVVGV